MHICVFVCWTEFFSSVCVCAYLNERESKSITHAVTLIVHFLLHVADRCNCICGTSTFFKCMQLCFVFYFFSFFAFRKNCFCYVSLSNSTSPPALPLKLATFCVANIDQCSTYIQLVKTFTFQRKVSIIRTILKIAVFLHLSEEKEIHFVILWMCWAFEVNVLNNKQSFIRGGPHIGAVRVRSQRYYSNWRWNGVRQK